MAKGPEIPQTDSAEIEILIERLKQNKCVLSGEFDPAASFTPWKTIMI